MRKTVSQTLLSLTFLTAIAAAGGCNKKDDKSAEATAAAKGDQKTDGAGGHQADDDEAAHRKADKGVDLANKTIKMGALNDESGPAAAIGKPYAVGKRVLAAAVNAGGTGILPEGWTVELVEKDHGYNPQKAVQAYNEIKDEVLFIGTSFGTPNTLPLRPMLERDNLVAFPASLSSKMAEHVHTPPVGTPYSYEAARAMDWVVEHSGGADKVKAGIVYQQDDYGQDGLNGWKKAASKHGVTIVSEQAIAPTQKDFTAVVTELKKSEANYVLLTTLPSATGPVLGTAAQLQYGPTWIGNTPSWIDKFFVAEVLPPTVLTNFYWATSLPYWGEDLPGMDKFLEAFKAHGGGADPDFYILVSYVQGLAALEAARQSIEAGDMTRDGYLDALRSIKRFDAGGLFKPADFTTTPYVTNNTSRILKPVLDKKTWEVRADYAAPAAFE